MADVNSPLDISNLDFDQIKTNLKSFLKRSSEFSDYDFEGSNLSTLIDLLAYNTYYNSYYLNMVGNEMFLDTAVLRESLLSKTKELNYVPQSAIASSATVNLLVEYDGSGTTPTIITIPRNTKFTATVDGKTYSFNTDTSYSAFQVGSTAHYSVDNVRIVEGEALTFSYDVHNSITPQKYIIPNDNVDVSQLRVFVQTSGSSLDRVVYNKADNLFGLDSTSTSFFLQPFTGNQYEIVFGDGVFGKALETGNIVSIEYCATDGDETNGADSFTFADSIAQVASITATTVAKSSGGSFEESTASIRFRAPRHYATQFRAVTAADYKSLIEQSHPQFRSVRVFGGEEADPPQYGKVFIAVRPGEEDTLAEVEKNAVISFLADKKVVSVQTEVIDPEYIYLEFQYEVNFDPNKTSLTASEIEEKVRNTIITFGNNNLGKFGASLRASKFATEVDKSESSILSSTGTFNLAKRILPNKNQTQSFSFTFSNPLRILESPNQPTIFSSQFTTRFPANDQGALTEAFIQDDGAGKLFVYTSSNLGTGQTIIQADAGTVDYSTGQLNIQNVLVADFPESYGIEIKTLTQIFDVKPVGNQILIVNESSLQVKSVSERIASV